MMSAEHFTCEHGQRHYGRHGAAGLLLVRGASVALQHRSANVDDGGTWGLPGGACEDRETPLQAAVRETEEETLGFSPAAVDPVAEHVAACACGWTYTTVVASYTGRRALEPASWESAGMLFVPVDSVPTFRLHPGLAAAWEELRPLVAPALDPEAPRTIPRPTEPPSDPGRGWRLFFLTASGHLAPPVAGGDVWTERGVAGWCVLRGHRAPAEGCTCGVRVVGDQAELLELLSTEDGRFDLGVTPEGALQRDGAAYLADRRTWGVVDVPDVIASVEWWGLSAPSPEAVDPPSTVRAEFARIGPRLYLSPHLAPRARELARTYRCEVVVGSRFGLDWLAEVAEHQAAHPLPEKRYGRVVGLEALRDLQPPPAPTPAPDGLPRASLRERLGAATVGASPEQMQRLSDEFAALLAADDPEAVALYESQQADLIGPDPLAEGACTWPEALSVRRGPSIYVTPSAPLEGWRMWHLDDRGRLVAPFLAGKWQLDRKAPGVQWSRGVNRNSAKHCRHKQTPPGYEPQPHPAPWCRCGIRVVQSLTVLRAFAESTADAVGARPAVLARVAFWGRVAPWAPDDDWQHTARAEYAAIVGDLMLPPDLEHHRPRLVARYGPALERTLDDARL